MSLSIVIPVYNASSTIVDLVEELNQLYLSQDLEIVLVNDCSKDNTDSICKDLVKKYNHLKYISLRKNYGEHNAVICGLNFVTKEVTVIMDDDFQNPPSEVQKLYVEMMKGHDVVYSKYKRKEHTPFRNFGSWMNHLVSGFLLSKPKGLYLSSFKAISLEVVKEIVKYKGPFPYIDGLVLRVTNSIGTVETEHASRKTGSSNYTFKKLVSLYLNMFCNFSVKPLRIITGIGFFAFVLGVLFSILFVVEKFLRPDTPLGWASIITSVFIFSGIQLIFLGLMGEYLGKLYLSENQTPQWTIKEKFTE